MATTLELAQEAGHEVRVIVDDEGTTGRHHGLDCTVHPTRRATFESYEWCDVVFTQLASRNRAMRFALLTSTPLVHFVHMGRIARASMLGMPVLVVFPAEWLRDVTGWPGATTVLNPPILAERVETTPGDRITLVNLTEVKGSATFFALARARPQLPFLGVRGGWGTQSSPAEVPANVTLMDPVPDIRTVFARTRILLMPSRMETFGRVGLEAACSGIPTVAAPVPGLLEALGDAATYAEAQDFDGWLAALDQLGDPGVYARRSSAARDRARSMHPRRDVHDTLALVERLIAARSEVGPSGP